MRNARGGWRAAPAGHIVFFEFESRLAPRSASILPHPVEPGLRAENFLRRRRVDAGIKAVTGDVPCGQNFSVQKRPLALENIFRVPDFVLPIRPGIPGEL